MYDHPVYPLYAVSYNEHCREPIRFLRRKENASSHSGSVRKRYSSWWRTRTLAASLRSTLTSLNTSARVTVRTPIESTGTAAAARSRPRRPAYLITPVDTRSETSLEKRTWRHARGKSQMICVSVVKESMWRVESVELPRRDGYHQRQDARNMGRWRGFK